MAIYLKQFENHTQYENYINGSGAILPNVSICTTEGDVHYNPSTPPTPTETRVVCKYNVTDTSSETKLCDYKTNFSAMEIDDVEQAEVVSSYTFSTTGEHTVKFTLTNPTEIGYCAFTNCENITSIEIPSGVATIESIAFGNCESLTSITIPNSVTTIGDTAFGSCESLTSINIPDSVISIGYGAFCACNSLDETSIAAIEAINPDDAFYCD